MVGYKKTEPREIEGNVFRMIGDEWMLVTASDKDGRYNTMTASWGGMGILWGEPVCFVFVRPQRYTHEFSESGELATLSFFRGEYMRELGYCGSKSGRDTDKIADTGLLPVTTDEGAVGFSQAKLILSCRKLYSDKLREASFHDEAIREADYPHRDYHTVYVYKIEGVYEKE